MTARDRASITVMNDRVDFVCARPEHQRAEPDDALTMHEDRWAYCSGGTRGPHDWQPIEGMSLDDAKRYLGKHAIQRVDPTD
jgi:hypothetical protein